MHTLDGKVIIVTGASRGIGEAASRHLAARGATVVLAARDEVRIAALAHEITAAGGEALARCCDVACADEVQALVTAAHNTFGRIDVLVNNAAVIEPIARLADSDPDAWSAAIDINLKGVYHGIRAVLPVMLDQGCGTIINLSSGAASHAIVGYAHYCASKAGVLALTRCVDAEYRSHGITVVGLSPGMVATGMQARIRLAAINEAALSDPASHSPPEWIARAIAFLCGPEASTFAGRDFNVHDDANRRLAGLSPPS